MTPLERLPTFVTPWTEPEVWPFDTPTDVFFARAINRVGEALEPEWEGVEFGLSRCDIDPSSAQSGDLVRHLPALVRADPSLAPEQMFREERARKLAAIRPHSVAGEAGTVARAAAHGSDFASRLADYQRRARDAAEKVRAAEVAYIERADRVRRRIVEALVAGRLEAAYRWDGDGKIYPSPANWWNADHSYVADRFRTCKIDRLHPTRRPNGPGSRDYCWLYLNAERLDAFLAPIERPNKVAGQRRAEEALERLCKAFQAETGPVPVGAAWRESAQTDFGISERAAARAWSNVALRYPFLSSAAGKPKARRADR